MKKFLSCILLVLSVWQPVLAQSPANNAAALGNYVFYGKSGNVCASQDAYWYRSATLEKQGERYPFVGYYLTGQPYMYGFYSSMRSGGIKDGYFLYYDTLGIVFKEGEYRKDLRVGIWKYYHPGTQVLMYEEEFKKGVPMTVTSYDTNGRAAWKRPLSNNPGLEDTVPEVRYLEFYGKRFKITTNYGKSTFSGTADETPAITGPYSQGYLDSNIIKKVAVMFRINDAGYPEDIRVVSTAHPELHEEAIKMIRNMPRWKKIPKSDKSVPMYYKMSVVFREE